MNPDRSEISRAFTENGFSDIKFCSKKHLEPYTVSTDFLTDENHTAVIAALPYPVRPLKSPKEDYVEIAPFAARDYYKEAVKKIKSISLMIREKTGLSKKDIRIFCNSQLPEKLMAASCGLGSIGKNSLLITPHAGSLCILAGMILPYPLETDPLTPEAVPAGKQCGSCTLCVENCPVSAIKENGIINTNLCLQARSHSHEHLPAELKEKWGIRLYGCQSCMEVCPHNKKAEKKITGISDNRVPISEILNKTTEELDFWCKNSALSPKWIDKTALQRNALISCSQWNSRETEELLKTYSRSSSEILKEAALWSLKKRGHHS